MALGRHHFPAHLSGFTLLTKRMLLPFFAKTNDEMCMTSSDCVPSGWGTRRAFFGEIIYKRETPSSI